MVDNINFKDETEVDLLKNYIIAIYRCHVNFTYTCTLTVE